MELGVRKPVVSPTGSRPMLVVIHDFAPVFVRELSTIVETLLPIVGHQLSAAVVPRWRGSSSGRTGEGYRELMRIARERLLHGWTHQSRDWWQPISLLTGRADEFRGLGAAIIRQRIEAAQAEFTELTGEAAQGLLPPRVAVADSRDRTRVAAIRDEVSLARMLPRPAARASAGDVVVGLGTARLVVSRRRVDRQPVELA